MHRGARRLHSPGLLDLVLILALLRQSDIDLLSLWSENDDALPHEVFHDDGPLLGIVSSPIHHFQHQATWGGLGPSHKSIDAQYDSTMEEYDRIMRDIRSRPPVISAPTISRERERVTSLNQENIRQNNENTSVITMVLSIPNEAPFWQQSAGGVQIASRNVQSEGAVGGMGVGLPYSSDENFDIFSNYIPGNMREDEINSLLLSQSGNTANTASNQTYLDMNWQQFIADYDNLLTDARGSMKGLNNSLGNWGNLDILNEAVQNAELFLPVAAGSQNSTTTSLSSSDIQGIEDATTASRLEVIEYSEWASQNHEDDLLFPSLPPPSYDEVVAMEQPNSTPENTTTQQQPQIADHMHDHNYFNASSTPSSNDVTSQRAGYAIISRHRVSTRVVTVSPRPRRVSNGTGSSVSEASDIVDLTSDLSSAEVTRSSVRRITTGSDSGIEEMTEQSLNGIETNSFEVQPLNLSYFENFNKDVSLRREVILCN